jgi:hypothetical protein
MSLVGFNHKDVRDPNVFLDRDTAWIGMLSEFATKSTCNSRFIRFKPILDMQV